MMTPDLSFKHLDGYKLHIRLQGFVSRYMEQIENKGLQMKIQFLLASSASIFATEFHLSYSTMKSDENIKINLGMIF